MIKPKEDRQGKIEIDLTGPEGNAFVLLAYAEQYAKELGFDGKRIVKEMKTKDYEHLISTFDKYFGEYVDLLRQKGVILYEATHTIRNCPW